MSGFALQKLSPFLHKKKISAFPLTRFLVGFPPPCPAFVSTLIRRGAPCPLRQCCSSETSLKECRGTTRSSWSAVVRSIAGYCKFNNGKFFFYYIFFYYIHIYIIYFVQQHRRLLWEEGKHSVGIFFFFIVIHIFHHIFIIYFLAALPGTARGKTVSGKYIFLIYFYYFFFIIF